jgi:hypothetical protein
MKRSELYALIWSEAARTLAPKLGMSDRGLSKLCERFDIPTPPRGYWARVASGASVQCAALPDPVDDFEINVLAVFDAEGGRRAGPATLIPLAARSPLAAVSRLVCVVAPSVEVDSAAEQSSSDLREPGQACKVTPEPNQVPVPCISDASKGKPAVATLPAAPACTVSHTADPAPGGHFACALFSDGRLILEVGNRSIMLTDCQARELTGYLGQFAGGG